MQNVLSSFAEDFPLLSATYSRTQVTNSCVQTLPMVTVRHVSLPCGSFWYVCSELYIGVYIEC